MDSSAEEHQEGKTQALQERRAQAPLRAESLGNLSAPSPPVVPPHLPAVWPVSLGPAVSLLPRLLVLSGSVHSTLFSVFVEQPRDPSLGCVTGGPSGHSFCPRARCHDPSSEEPQVTCPLSYK